MRMKDQLLKLLILVNKLIIQDNWKSKTNNFKLNLVSSNNKINSFLVKLIKYQESRVLVAQELKVHLCNGKPNVMTLNIDLMLQFKKIKDQLLLLLNSMANQKITEYKFLHYKLLYLMLNKDKCKLNNKSVYLLNNTNN